MPEQSGDIENLLGQIRQASDIEFSSIFTDADNATLIRRYGESRRLHPLSRKDLSLDQAILQETHLLAPLSSTADLRIDTSTLSIHDLSEQICERILGRKEKELVLVFESFGFKHGTTKDADFVFDARFLPNPHWVPELRALTGLDGPVRDYLQAQPDVMLYSQQIDTLLSNWLPHLERNNRSYVTVAIGCTGGQLQDPFLSRSSWQPASGPATKRYKFATGLWRSSMPRIEKRLPIINKLGAACPGCHQAGTTHRQLSGHHHGQ